MDDELWRPFEGRYPDGMPLIGQISVLHASETQAIEFPWCVHLVVHFDDADEFGYPTKLEGQAIDDFSEAVLAQLRVIDTVIEAARLTGHGARELWWFVRDPEPMHDLLGAIAAQRELYRAFDYDIDLDVDWTVIDRLTGRRRPAH